MKRANPTSDEPELTPEQVLGIDPLPEDEWLRMMEAGHRYELCDGCGFWHRHWDREKWQICRHLSVFSAASVLRRGGFDGTDFVSVSVEAPCNLWCSSCRLDLGAAMLSEQIEVVCAAQALDWLLEVGEGSYGAS